MANRLTRAVLAALVAILLGSALVAAFVSGGDGGSGEVAGNGTSSSTIEATSSPSTTAGAATPTSTAAPLPAPTTTSTSAVGGSGFTSDGSGEIAGGPPRIADTGAESALAPAAVLAALSLSLARLVRRSR